jgi:hypothetical protein
MSIGTILPTVPVLPDGPATHGHPRRDPHPFGSKGEHSRHPDRHPDRHPRQHEQAPPSEDAPLVTPLGGEVDRVA